MNPEKNSLCNKILADSSLFKTLSSAELDKLLAYTRTKTYKRNKTIFSKGDEGGQLFAILSGTIKINTLSEEGKEITLAFLEKGDFFGEMAMFQDEYRTATAIMHSEGEVLIIEYLKFLSFLEKMPKVAIKLIQVLSKRLREADELLEDTLFLNLPVRLAKKLLSLAVYHGKKKDKEITINLKLTQTELGSLVNSSRESINKLMRDWKEAEIVDFKEGYITIKNVQSLENLAGGYKSYNLI